MSYELSLAETVITILKAGSGVPGDMGMSIKIAPMTTETVYNARTCFSYNGSSEYRITTQPILPDLTGFTVSMCCVYMCYMHS